MLCLPTNLRSISCLSINLDNFKLTPLAGASSVVTWDKFDLWPLLVFRAFIDLLLALKGLDTIYKNSRIYRVFDDLPKREEERFRVKKRRFTGKTLVFCRTVRKINKGCGQYLIDFLSAQEALEALEDN